MSLALKRILPKLYQKLKSIKNKIPANVEFWDKKQYKVTNKINDLFKPWKTWDALIKESDFVFKNYNGGDFIDVGAFAGFYSFLLAPKSNPFDNFVSCEPDANVKINLLENLAILTNTFNKLRISFINSPINNGDDVTIIDTSFGHPSFRASNDSFNNKKIIKSVSLDSVVQSLSLKPKFIKIDVEGAEFDVLQGMQETLKKYKPEIMLEKHPSLVPKNITLKDIDNFLIKNGYYSEFISSEKDIAIREIWKNS